MLKQELRQKLTELGVAFDPKAKAPELRKLLEENSPEEPVITPPEESPTEEVVADPAPVEVAPEVTQPVEVTTTSTDVEVVLPASPSLPFTLGPNEKFVTLANGLKVVEVDASTHTFHKLDLDGKLMTF